MCLFDGAVETAWRDENLMEKKSCRHCIFNAGQANAGIIIRMLSVAFRPARLSIDFFVASGRPDFFQVFAVGLQESVPLKVRI